MLDRNVTDRTAMFHDMFVLWSGLAAGAVTAFKHFQRCGLHSITALTKDRVLANDDTFLMSPVSRYVSRYVCSLVRT